MNLDLETHFLTGFTQNKLDILVCLCDYCVAALTNLFISIVGGLGLDLMDALQPMVEDQA